MESVLRTSTSTTQVEVRYVWEYNLNREFRLINEAIKGKYHLVAFDTEFKLAPDKKNVVKTHPRFASPDERYCAIKPSTDKGDLRQLGLTLSVDDAWLNRLALRSAAGCGPCCHSF